MSCSHHSERRLFPFLKAKGRDYYFTPVANDEIFKYLRSKEKLTDFNIEEELVFFPELYGICPRNDHEGCLNLPLYKDLRKTVKKYVERTSLPNKRYPMIKYAYEYNFVEMYMDEIGFSDGIPSEIFLCTKLRRLSLKSNNLKLLSPEVGRLKELEVLELTNNSLKTSSLPYTLTFCRKLHTLYLDHNNLFALPGFLLEMGQLETIRRLSSKCTLRDIFDIEILKQSNRIEPRRERSYSTNFGVNSLQKMAAGVLVSSKYDFLQNDILPVVHQNIVCSVYFEYVICDNCRNPRKNEQGYTIYTLRMGHLGNTWSAFSLVGCCRMCATEIDTSARIVEEFTLKDRNYYYSPLSHCTSMSETFGLSDVRPYPLPSPVNRRRSKRRKKKSCTSCTIA